MWVTRNTFFPCNVLPVYTAFCLILQAMENQTQGIKVLGTMLHSHLLGRAIRVRHFRKGVELPVLSEDNAYDFNFQYTRFLENEVDVIPVSLNQKSCK